METNSAAATTDIEDLPVVDVLVDVPGRHPAAAAVGGVQHEGGAGEHQAALQSEGCSDEIDFGQPFAISLCSYNL